MDHRKPQSSSRPWLVGFAILASVFLGYKVFFHDTPLNVNSAIVVLSGDSSVTGTVTFKQSSPGSKQVVVTGSIRGLTPGALHGFHVHQSGDLSGGCASAGPHYNPFGKTHGAPSAANRHVGDLGNIEADQQGEANFVLTDGLLSLNGPTSIIGRSVVLHAGTDDLGLGGNEESLKTGNAGARAACGVIGLS